MRGSVGIAALSLFVAACVPSSQELVRQYNEDGVLLYERGEFNHAQESFEAAQKLAPEDLAIVYNLAQCHDRRGDAATAEKLYRECLTRAPNHAACRHSLAVLWVRAGRQNEA